jgi:hypothetical protein
MERIFPFRGNGSFLPWIETEFEMTVKTAQRFMNVASVYGAKYDTVSDLGLRTLYELAAPNTPQEVRDEVERRVAAAPTFVGWVVG